MKRITALLVALVILTSGQGVLAAQFEDYQWGASFEAVLTIVEGKGVPILKKSKDTPLKEGVIRYDDVIFENPCEIDLRFLEKSGLSFVIIDWGNINYGMYPIKEKALGILTEKYNEPLKVVSADSFEIETYRWFSKSESGRQIEVTFMYNDITDPLESLSRICKIVYSDKKVSDDLKRIAEEERLEREKRDKARL